MNKLFTDMHGRTICDGAEVYFNGQFPVQVPEENHIRNGIAIIEGDKLVFAVNINDQLQGIGLYWDFDNEPCYDLIMNKYRLEFYDALTDELIEAYEGNDLDALYAQGFHNLDRGYGVEIDNAEPKKSKGGIPREMSEPMEPNATMRFIEELDEKHSNAIPIFGGAIWIDPTDTERIINYLPSIIRSAQIWKWHGGLADACRQFCHCLFIDPMLIEACIGMTFEKLTEDCYV